MRPARFGTGDRLHGKTDLPAGSDDFCGDKRGDPHHDGGRQSPHSHPVGSDAADPGRMAVAEGNEVSAGLVAALAEHRHQLVRFFRSRTGDGAEAEDVVQEIWLHVSRAETGPVANPLAYLHRVGMNIVLDRVRERRRRERREQDWSDVAIGSGDGEARDNSPSPLDVVEGRERVRLLAAAIEKLPPGASRVFRRHKLDGLSHSEVAAELGISRSAVEKHIAVAMRHLREALG